MTAEIYIRKMEDGNTETRVKGTTNNVIPLALILIETVAELHAQQVGAPKWCTLMAMADTLKERAEMARNEDGGLS